MPSFGPISGAPISGLSGAGGGPSPFVAAKVCPYRGARVDAADTEYPRVDAGDVELGTADADVALLVRTDMADAMAGKADAGDYLPARPDDDCCCR